MTNRELDHLLKSVTPPARDEAYWEAFPEGVTRHLNTPPKRPTVVEQERPPRRLLWNLGLGSACAAVAAFLVLRFFGVSDLRDAQFRVLEQSYREATALFPKQLKAVVLESGEFRLQLADRPGVPAAPPLFVRICEASQCATAITFSGQEVDMLGRKFEVLADGRDGIILLGQGVAWTTGETPVGGKWRVDSGWLEKRL